MSDNVAALLKLEQQLRSASEPAQLFYSIVNETHQCVPYTQAVLFSGQDVASMELIAASDLATVDYTSPFVVWLQSLIKSISQDDLPQKSVEVMQTQMADMLSKEWQQFSPEHLLWVPLKVAANEGALTGVLLLFRTERWSETEKALMDHLGGSMGHAMFAWRRWHPLKRFRNILKQRKVVVTVLCLILAVMWLPVRLNALAPVEVIAKEPATIAAPIDGAVKKVLVEPNQQVRLGDPLVQFDDTELSSEFDVSQQALLVAQAELKTASQSGFLDPSQKSKFAELDARVKLREAELEYARSRLEKALVRAPESGIAVLGDPDQWQGRPASVGEKILLLADPAAVELEIMLPVKDSVALEQGASATIFFDSDPLNAYSAIVNHAEYRPTKTPDDVLAFRLIATLSSSDRAPPRIGSRGTAKVYGDEVRLFFYLFRRPITSLRQWLGW